MQLHSAEKRSKVCLLEKRIPWAESNPSSPFTHKISRVQYKSHCSDVASREPADEHTMYYNISADSSQLHAWKNFFLQTYFLVYSVKWEMSWLLLFLTLPSEAFFCL